MAVEPEVLRGIQAGFSHAVLVFVDPQGYPLSVATEFQVDAERGVILLDPPAGSEFDVRDGTEVNVIVSHIKPQATGYDERRYVQLWGTLGKEGARYALRPTRGHSWDEAKVPFFKYSEVTVPQAHAYLDGLGRERGRPVKPRL